MGNAATKFDDMPVTVVPSRPDGVPSAQLRNDAGVTIHIPLEEVRNVIDRLTDIAIHFEGVDRLEDLCSCWIPVTACAPGLSGASAVCETCGGYAPTAVADLVERSQS